MATELEPEEAPVDGTTLTEDVGEATEEVTTEPTAEELQQQLLDAKRKISEMGNQNAELRKQLEGSKPPERQPTQPEEPDYLESFSEDELLANPHLAIKAAQMVRDDLVKQFGGVLAELRQEFSGKLRSVDPERLAMKDRIEELRNDPDMQGVDDEVLLKIAKREARRTTKKPPARPPGGGSAPRGGSGSTSDDVRKSPLFKEIYGDVLVEAAGEAQ